jgi:hypothetical protein
VIRKIRLVAVISVRFVITLTSTVWACDSNLGDGAEVIGAEYPGIPHESQAGSPL